MEASVKAFLAIGEVLKPRGLDGTVKLRADIDGDKQLSGLKRLYLDEAGKTALVVNKVSCAGAFAYLRLDTIDSPEKAEPLRGKTLYARREDLPPLDKGRYYLADLLGARVTDADGVELGVLTDILPYPAHAVYRLVDQSGRERLAPAVPGLIENVDLALRTITVNRQRFDEVSVLEN